MDIKLSWVNPNQVYDEIKIFRSETPIDKQNLPEPIATLTQVGVNEFVDTGLVQGKRYYYALRIAYGTDYIVSDAIATQAMHYTGPLGQELLFGDMDLGYFGYVSTSYFLSQSQIAEFFNPLLNVSSGWLIVHNWHKFAYKGKILIIPGNSLRGQVTWNELYNAGLVYGNDVPEWETGGVPQGKKIVVGQDSFTIRLFKGFDNSICPTFNSRSTTVSGNSRNRIYGTTLTNPIGEYFDIMNSFTYANDGRIPLTDLGSSFARNNEDYFNLLQDSYQVENSSNGVAFGNSLNSNGSGVINGYDKDRHSYRPLAGISIGKNQTSVNISSGTRYTAWLPVFELEV